MLWNDMLCYRKQTWMLTKLYSTCQVDGLFLAAVSDTVSDVVRLFVEHIARIMPKDLKFLSTGVT